MFIVESQDGEAIVSTDPLEAVKVFLRRLPLRDLRKDRGEATRHYHVWNTMTGDFHVIARWLDRPPTGHQAYETVFHATKLMRQKLIDAMMHEAQCDETVLKQIAEMAAMQIDTDTAYRDWVGEDDETDS